MKRFDERVFGLPDLHARPSRSPARRVLAGTGHSGWLEKNATDEFRYFLYMEHGFGI